MEISHEPRAHHSVLHLRGEFDTFHSQILLQEIEGLVFSGESRVVLDLRLVRFINSTALGAIVRSSRLLARRGGRLVVCRPSAFVRSVIEKVELRRIIQVCDTEEEAAEAVLSDLPGPSGDPVEATEDPSLVLFTPAGGGRKPAVGRMLALDAAGLAFTWTGDAVEAGLATGAELTVKFRLPLLAKARYEAQVTVTGVEQRDEDLKVSTAFTRIDGEARRATEQYARDMAYLREELTRPGN